MGLVALVTHSNVTFVVRLPRLSSCWPTSTETLSTEGLCSNDAGLCRTPQVQCPFTCIVPRLICDDIILVIPTSCEHRNLLLPNFFASATSRGHQRTPSLDTHLFAGQRPEKTAVCAIALCVLTPRSSIRFHRGPRLAD